MKTNLALMPEENDPHQEQGLQESIHSIALVKVVDADTHKQATENCKAVVAIEKRVGEYWDPLCDGAHKNWKALVAKRKEFLDPLEAIKKAQSADMKAWEREQEAKRLEAERLAQEIARKQAEDEAIAAAAALEKQGTPEAKAEAEKIMAAPVDIPQVVVKSVVPKGGGSFTRDNWKAEVTNIKALARAVLAGQVPEQALMGNTVFLGQQARSLKKGMAWPGVRVWAD
jgi:hypothetical protein